MINWQSHLYVNQISLLFCENHNLNNNSSFRKLDKASHPHIKSYVSEAFFHSHIVLKVDTDLIACQAMPLGIQMICTQLRNFSPTILYLWVNFTLKTLNEVEDGAASHSFTRAEGQTKQNLVQSL